MVAVITGASGGIGRETADELVKAGYDVVCLSRTPCGNEKVKSIKCDITDRKQAENAFAQIEKIDLLINNAGFGVSGSVEFTDMAEIRAQFELNYFALVSIVQCALPMLRKSGGRIINISSAASVFSIPFQSFYSATKASVESLTLALNNELKQFGVSSCAVRLGDVKTGFTAARKKILPAMMFTAALFRAALKLWKMMK
ncbi:MAG: SDR family NAD(P)-dependent oxidoreductase [Clostridiales bacterium]|nr:SDR family NAD(P)-dependent oxidoreductase [Clostridiales bacterium]